MDPCGECGRFDGHWLGCPAAPQFTMVTKPVVEPPATDSPQCEAQGCQALAKPWGGRGARPKFCASHSKTK